MTIEKVVSKQQKAFYRKLLIAHYISTEKHNLLSLHKLTSMPRRTLQDAIVALADLGIECEFVQEGSRHNAGYYQINDWGAINQHWLELNTAQVMSVL